MANELAIAIPVTTSVAPTAASPESESGSGDFVAALTEALTAEAVAASLEAAPLPPTAVASNELTDELMNTEDLLDASVLFVDPQALLLSVEHAQRATIAVTTPSVSGGKAPGVQPERTALAALASAATLNVPEKNLSNADALDASGRAGRDSLLEAKLESKPGSENGNAGVLSTNAMTHERATDLRDRPVIRAHVGTSSWTEELAGKLTVMVGRGMQSASLQLSPEHLGPLEIRITVQNEQASVWFGAAHADTRTALEQALPRLREMLAGQGLNLSDAGVFREAPRQQNKQYSGAHGLSVEGEREMSFAVGIRGMVDAYA